MDTSRQKLVDEMLKLRKTNVPGYLGVLAILCLSNDKTEPPEGYSRGNFKRAIKSLREFQRIEKDSEWVESAIALIRRDWLHKGADL